MKHHINTDYLVSLYVLRKFDNCITSNENYGSSMCYSFNQILPFPIYAQFTWLAGLKITSSNWSTDSTCRPSAKSKKHCAILLSMSTTSNVKEGVQQFPLQYMICTFKHAEISVKVVPAL